MKIKKYLSIISVAIGMILVLTACRESNQVSYNISKEADTFNVLRRIEVINARTDKPVFELVGNFSLKNNSNKELEVICETGPGEYKKHLIYLNDWTLYFVEDISGAEVSKYHYEVNFLPQEIVPFSITMSN